MLAGMSRYERPSHRVYMTFFSRQGWQVQFSEADLKTPLPRTFTFADPEKIRELARRGEAWGDSENRQMLESARQLLLAADARAVREAETSIHGPQSKRPCLASVKSNGYGAK
jgi:hypothetical protein